MQRLKVNIVYLFIVLFFQVKSNAMAWTDWKAETPGGNKISDNWGPKALIVKDSFILSNLVEWYFYKNYVIGKYSPVEGSLSRKYFIYNEVVSTLDTFENRSDWTNQLHQRKLNPSVWTRWYSRDWDSLSIQDIFFVCILLLLFGMVLSIKILKEYFKIQHPRTVFIFGIILIVIVLKLKLSFPGSF